MLHQKKAEHILNFHMTFAKNLADEIANDLIEVELQNK